MYDTIGYIFTRQTRTQRHVFRIVHFFFFLIFFFFLMPRQQKKKKKKKKKKERKGNKITNRTEIGIKKVKDKKKI